MRRIFPAFWLIFFCAAPCSQAAAPGSWEKIIGAANINLSGPILTPQQGLPIGNGRMGSMVWTTPYAVEMQVNRVDVYASDRNSASFPLVHDGFCGGCGGVALEWERGQEPIFSGRAARQELRLTEGLGVLQGRGVEVQTAASMNRDVIAVRVIPTSLEPFTVNPILKLLRPAEFRQGKLAATSRLRVREGLLILTQEFAEGDHFCRSALVVSSKGDKVDTFRPLGRDSAFLALAPRSGAREYFITSAASFDPKEDVEATALRLAHEAEVLGFAGLQQENRTWWHEFWGETPLTLHSADGRADRLQHAYHYFLYLSAATSRGKLPPKFNGLLFDALGDARMWGDMHWWHNVSCLYDGLPPTGKWDLLDPVFRMYSDMLPACAQAARDLGSEGIFIPETVHYNGPPTLPPPIAAELRAARLSSTEVKEFSPGFREFASHVNPFLPYWNWLRFDSWVSGKFEFSSRGSGQHGYVSHIFSSGAKMAHLYWLRYQYTGDRDWLAQRAYPIIKGCAEFYRHYPNLVRESDGRLHLHDANSHEGVWGARDPLHEMTALQGIFPLAVRAATELGMDPELVKSWQETRAALAPLPLTSDPDAIIPGAPGAPVAWTLGRLPVRKVNVKATWPEPLLFMDVCNLDSKDSTLLPLARASAAAGLPPQIAPGCISPINHRAIVAARLGQADLFVDLALAQITGPLIFPNQLCDVEGGPGLPGTADEHLGRMTQALHEALLQANPPEPGADPVLRVLPAWPVDWDARFTLQAPGGFSVSVVREGGRLRSLEILSVLGKSCVLRNPWKTAKVLARCGDKRVVLTGELLHLETARGERWKIEKAVTTQ